MSELTQEQFQEQFKIKLEYSTYLINVIRYSYTFFNTRVYKFLGKLVIKKDDGKYYMN